MNGGTALGQVLLVEDDEALAHVLAHALRGVGHRVSVAGSGEEAVPLLAEAEVLLTDVCLPGAVDGVALLREARKRGVEGVVFTGHGSLELAAELVREDAVDLLYKPVDSVLVQNSVARALERRRLRRIAALYQGCHALMRGPEPFLLTDRFAQFAAASLSCDRASVLLAETGQLHRAVSHGLPPEADRVAPADGVAARALLLGTPILLQGAAREDPRFSTASPSRVESAVLWPVEVGGQQALLCLSRSQGPRFTGNDLGLVEILAGQLRLILELLQATRRTASLTRLAALAELTGGVAHEINNPMAFVRSNLKFVEDCLLELLGTVTLLNEGRPAEALSAWDAAGGPGLFAEVQHAIDEAVQGADRVSSLVRDMRQVSRVHDGPAEPFPLREAVELALRLTAGELRDVSVHLGVSEALWVEADRARVAQAVMNLVRNAVHAMERSPRKELRLWTQLGEGSVTLHVEDTGVGVPPELQARIFDPFFTTRSAGRGTGLGLAIARQALRAFGGELEHRPRAGQGALFSARLPLAPSR